MIRASTFAAVAAAALLSACGGSDVDNDATVNSMVAAPAAYGRAAVWTVSGLNLDKGISFSITDGQCGPVAELGDGTANQRQFSCRVASLGELIGRVNDSRGKLLATLRVIIPTPTVELVLSQGTIQLELDPTAAPVTVNNFLNYVNTSFYNGTIFHRVIKDFVIQGGGFTVGTPNPVPKTPTFAPIVLETNRGLNNVRGSLAMARTAAPNSATSSYYINVVDNPSLDYQSEQEPGYAVFGRVTAGIDIVDAISIVPTHPVPSLGLTHVPDTNVVVTTARQVR